MNSNDTSKQNVIPGTQRKDGTVRKDVKVRPGYVNQDEVPKYVAPAKRDENKSTKTEEVVVDSTGQQAENTAEGQQDKKKRIRNKKKDSTTNEETKEETTNEKDGGDGEKALSENEKQMRKLKKKLRQIEDLEKKRATGNELNEDELSKIQSKFDVLKQINDLKVK